MWHFVLNQSLMLAVHLVVFGKNSHSTDHEKILVKFIYQYEIAEIDSILI
ncbi:hypothetical protein ACINWC743_2214 [Acinetobacter sp. WC-743]|nr:hypothetical protein ACINWC743_2214 [Acinetobacter sp. WC-743]